jgi:hypothetical protein
LRLAGRWLSDFLRLGLGLTLALAAMQLPAITAAYDAALVQVSEQARSDIAQRESAARDYYGLTGRSEEVIAALRTREPSNAQGLETSIAREEALRGAHARIAGASPLLRPVRAAWDLMDDPFGNKSAILRTAVALHEPQVLLGVVAATYGLVGLLLGLLLANLLLALLGWLARGGRAARHREAV